MRNRPIRHGDTLANASEQAMNLMDDVVDMPRVEMAPVSLNCQVLDCFEVMSEVARILEIAATKRGIMFTADTSANLPSILADRSRLVRVLINLGSNAIRANLGGGWVLVSAFPHEDMVRFVVRDTGPGIPVERYDEVFDPFSTVGAELGWEEGTGVALAISRAFVRGMKGRMGFESVVGAGRRFWVDLPVASDAGATAARAPEVLSAEDARSKVLYIEDKRANLELMHSIFEDLNQFLLISAQTVQAGIEIAQRVIPDLVITDIHLPDGQGFEVLERLRGDPRTAHIPVVALTADATRINLHNLQRAEFDWVLTKPFKLDELMGILRGRVQAA